MSPQWSFTFGQPLWLLVLLIIPVLLGLILWQQRQAWRDAFAFSQLATLHALKQSPHVIWLERGVPLFLLLALAFGIVALADPAFEVMSITRNSQLMLVMDISISMEATDVKPNRLTAAKEAAIRFVQSLPKDAQVGLQFFAGNSYLISPPTTHHRTILDYLRNLDLNDLKAGTAMGDALVIALEALDQARQTDDTVPPQAQLTRGTVILMTDGETNLGLAPLAALNEAIQRKTTVYTVGIGEEEGAYIRDGIYTRLDEPTLQLMAQQTGGDYYRVRTFNDFKAIYETIAQKTWGLQWEKHPLAVWCLGATLVFILAGMGWGVYFRRF